MCDYLHGINVINLFFCYTSTSVSLLALEKEGTQHSGLNSFLANKNISPGARGSAPALFESKLGEAESNERVSYEPLTP